MAKILLAATPEPRLIIDRVLAGHDLTHAQNMAEAERWLQERSFDLIVCTIIFDDSRMFDFLRLVKGNEAWKEIPFVCARVRSKTLAWKIALEGVAFTCRALGAAAFLDIADKTDSEMRQAIEQYLAKQPQNQHDGDGH